MNKKSIGKVYNFLALQYIIKKLQFLIRNKNAIRQQKMKRNDEKTIQKLY